MENEKNIRCNVCGSNDIEFLPHSRIGKCKSCGALLMLPDFEDHEILALLNQAYIQRTSYKFDEAISTYSFIIEKNPNEISAYEGLLLSKYGIVYEHDDDKNINVPTCRRYNPKNVLEDESYISYLSYCNSEEEKDVFRAQARQISQLQEEITYQLKNEKDYDVFISFKAKDENGKTSRDAEIARQLYDTLSDKGLRVFMSEVTLKNRISQEFEPIIFRALHSAKHFILVGTSKANVDSNWVRNEWSRFIDRIKDATDDVTLDSFICVYEGMDPNLFPRVNHKSIQCVDASDLSFKYNISDYICRNTHTKKVVSNEPLFGGVGYTQLLDEEERGAKRRKENYFVKNNPIKTTRREGANTILKFSLFITLILAAAFVIFLDGLRVSPDATIVTVLGICSAVAFGVDLIHILLYIFTLKSEDHFLHMSKDKLLHVSIGTFSTMMSVGGNLFYTGKDTTIDFDYEKKSYRLEIENKKISLFLVEE